VWGWGKVEFILFSKLLSIHWSNANQRPFLLLADILTPKKVSPIIRTDGRTDGLQTWWDMIVVTASTPHQMLGSLGSKSWVELLGGKEQFCCANVWHFVQFFNVLSANLKKFNTQTSSVKNGCLCFISLNKARSATYTSLGMFT